MRKTLPRRFRQVFYPRIICGRARAEWPSFLRNVVTISPRFARVAHRLRDIAFRSLRMRQGKELRVAVSPRRVNYARILSQSDLPARGGRGKRDHASVTRARPDTCPRGMSEIARSKWGFASKGFSIARGISHRSPFTIHKNVPTKI